MNDAERYQKQFDLMMQELEAEAKRRSNVDRDCRDATWKKFRGHFSKVADAKGWTPEQRETLKQRWLDILCPE